MVNSRGALEQAAAETDCRIVAGDPNWNDYTLSLRARKLGGAEGFLIMCRVRDDNHWIWWNLGGWGNQQHGLEQCVGGAKSMLGIQVSGRIETGRWYDIRIQVSSEKIRCYLDGQLIHDVSLVEAPLYAVASRVDASGEIILKVVNVSKVAQDTELELRGVQEVEPTAKAIVLTSADPAAENSLTEPTKVAPVCQPIDGAAVNFRHTFPANSLTVFSPDGQVVCRSHSERSSHSDHSEESLCRSHSERSEESPSIREPDPSLLRMTATPAQDEQRGAVNPAHRFSNSQRETICSPPGVERGAFRR